MRPKPRVRTNSLILNQEFDYLRPYETRLVRVGPKADCGYVIPESVANSTKSLYSIGISTDWDFEVEMAQRNPKLRVRAFDRSSGWKVFLYVGVRDLLRGDPSEVVPQSIRSRLSSTRKYFELAIRFRLFFTGRRIFKRLWVRSPGLSKDEITFEKSIEGIFRSGSTMIKIDIEGGEYQLANELLNALECNKSAINCVVMEFHDTHSRRAEFQKLVEGVSRHLPIVHLHGNNCAPVASDGLPHVIEITFAQNMGLATSQQLKFPLIGLDYPNDNSVPDCVFEFLPKS